MTSIILGILSLWVCSAQALTIHGVDNSGGGKAVVCRDEQKNIKRIQLLDLFEGETIYGLTSKSFGDSKEENLQGAKEILQATFAQMPSVIPIQYFIDRALKDFRLLPPDVKLAPVDDAAPIVIPSGCELEQLAYYQDNENLLVDQNLWNALDGKNKAALIMHEIIYLQARYEGDKDSRNARRVVAHIFSEYLWIPVMDGLFVNEIACYGIKKGETSAAFRFYRKDIFAEDTNSTYSLFQFVNIRNHLPFTKTTIEALPFPWPENVFSTYARVSNGDFETVSPIILGKEVDDEGNIQGYYFSEPDGKYFISCDDDNK